jgi:hypothetical protein
MSKNYKKTCCNPFLIHKKIIVSNLRRMPREIIDKSHEQFGFNNNTLVCTACLVKVVKHGPFLIESDNQSTDSLTESSEDEKVEEKEDEEEIIPPIEDETEKTEANQILIDLGVTPIKLRKYKYSP